MHDEQLALEHIDVVGSTRHSIRISNLKSYYIGDKVVDNGA